MHPVLGQGWVIPFPVLIHQFWNKIDEFRADPSFASAVNIAYECDKVARHIRNLLNHRAVGYLGPSSELNMLYAEISQTADAMLAAGRYRRNTDVRLLGGTPYGIVARALIDLEGYIQDQLPQY